jgi:hypothetical protein
MSQLTGESDLTFLVIVFFIFKHVIPRLLQYPKAIYFLELLPPDKRVGAHHKVSSRLDPRYQPYNSYKIFFGFTVSPSCNLRSFKVAMTILPPPRRINPASSCVLHFLAACHCLV